MKLYIWSSYILTLLMQKEWQIQKQLLISLFAFLNLHFNYSIIVNKKAGLSLSRIFSLPIFINAPLSISLSLDISKFLIMYLEIALGFIFKGMGYNGHFTLHSCITWWFAWEILYMLINFFHLDWANIVQHHTHLTYGYNNYELCRWKSPLSYTN